MTFSEKPRIRKRCGRWKVRRPPPGNYSISEFLRYMDARAIARWMNVYSL